ncbi:MAG: glutathionylspermidine synthase family protein [Epsilonproteobacteria bacterium]|nr:glutathionylspermidine synthase family protein [Campylobacterota bacterium]
MPLDNTALDQLGFTWHTNGSDTKHVSNSFVQISHNEAETYYQAANELYDMYVEAAEYVIENDLFFEIGIPFNLVDAIKKSWENDVHWHIYGRFDLAGGINGKPIKLIGFNADTPSTLFETALLQWAMLKHNNLDETKQFNEVYESMMQNFKRLITLFDDPEDFEKHYDGWKILFSSISGNEEEEATTKLLQQMATDAGFATHFEFLEDVQFDNNGIYDQNGNKYEYWFKLFPWEDIAILDANGNIVQESDEVYDNYKKVYQEFVEFPKDAKSANYQAEVFFAYEACGLGFRKGGAILDNMSKFVGHIIK